MISFPNFFKGEFILRRAFSVKAKQSVCRPLQNYKPSSRHEPCAGNKLNNVYANNLRVCNNIILSVYVIAVILFRSRIAVLCSRLIITAVQTKMTISSLWRNSFCKHTLGTYSVRFRNTTRKLIFCKVCSTLNLPSSSSLNTA